MSFETFFASDKFNLFQTIIPYVGSKKGLLIYRIIALIVLLFGYYCSVYATIYREPGTEWMWFSFFTNQNYVAITIYFLIGIVNYYKDKKGTLKGKISNTYVHTILHIFYNILFPLAFIVTTVFWSLIFPFMDKSYFTFFHWASNVIQHFLQFVFLGIDWYFITIPSNLHHFVPMFVVGIAYLIFAQIYHLIYDIWIYGFLDPSFTKFWYLLYIGLVIIWTILGFIFAGIQMFKNKNRKFINNYDNGKAANELV